MNQSRAYQSISAISLTNPKITTPDWNMGLETILRKETAWTDSIGVISSCKLFPYASSSQGASDQDGARVRVSARQPLPVHSPLFLRNKMHTNWLGRQNSAPLKFAPKPPEAAFSAVFRTSINADRK